MKDQHSVLLPTLDGKIEMPVAIEVSSSHAVWMRAAGDGNVSRRRYRTAAVTEQHRQVIGLMVGDGDVEPAVLVEVPRCEVRRIVPGGERRSRSWFESSS